MKSCWNKKWTYEACKEEALKYNSIQEFKEYSASCYGVILKNKWSDELFSHLKYGNKPPNYWTKKRCAEEALKYKTKAEFRKNSVSAYSASKKFKWLDEICSHMEIVKLPKDYWNDINKCKVEALKYKSKTDFQKYGRGAYRKSLENGWLDEICSHMEIVGSWHKRFIYAYEFPDNHVYVGLTYDISKRMKGHGEKGAVFNYIQETGLEPTFKKLTNLPVDVEEASKLEGDYLNKYLSDGWVKINKAKTGGKGSGIVKWTFQKCQEEALKYNTRSEFQKTSSGAYKACVRQKWLDEVTVHMTPIHSPNGYWTKERCAEEALKYTKRTEFKKGSKKAYGASCKKGWLDEICSHMLLIKKPDGFYTLEKCIELSKECKTLSEFCYNHSVAYRIVLANNWQKIVFESLKTRTPNNYWTLDKCIELAHNCSTMTELKTKNGTAYNTICKNKWWSTIKSNLIKKDEV